MNEALLAPSICDGERRVCQVLNVDDTLANAVLNDRNIANLDLKHYLATSSYTVQRRTVHQLIPWSHNISNLYGLRIKYANSAMPVTFVDNLIFCAAELLLDEEFILCMARNKSRAVNMPEISPLESTAKQDDEFSLTRKLTASSRLAFSSIVNCILRLAARTSLTLIDGGAGGSGVATTVDRYWLTNVGR